MRAGNIYENTLMPGVYIKVDVLKKTTAEYTYLTVSWYRKDEITKKLVNMDVKQEMVIPNSELKLYRMVTK